MNKFISKGDVELNINGVEFSLDSTDVGLIKTIDEFSKEAQEKADAMAKREDVVEALVEATEYVTDVIDLILGEGASKQIFKDTPISLFKATEVINYISESIGNSRISNSAKYSPNRAERRGK